MAGMPDLSQDGFQQSTFARSIGPYDGCELTAMNMEIDIFKDGVIAYPDTQILNPGAAKTTALFSTDTFHTR
jgi:hypothetical protein